METPSSPEPVVPSTAQEFEANIVGLPAEEQQKTGGQSREERIARLLPYQYKKGQSGNPTGRAGKGESLKEYAKRKLAQMSDEEKEEYLEGISKDTIWEMAENKAKADVSVSGNLSISKVLTDLENGGHETSPEGLENPAPIQNQEQATAVSEVQAEPSADPLQSAQVVKEFNP